MCNEISALKKINLDKLKKYFITIRIARFKTNKNALAKAVVIESRLDKGRGPVSTVLIMADFKKVFISGSKGKVRAMFDT